MKTEHWLILIGVLLLAMMVRDPKKTTAQITTGEQAAVGVGSAAFGGILTKPKPAKKG